jgi:hypothetical protein
MSHRVDIYEKDTVENDTGQLMADWILSISEQRCFFTPAGAAASIRISPTMEEADYLTMIFPHDCPISYGTRLYNLKSGTGDEVYYEGPLQVVQIDKHVSPVTQKVQFLQVKVKTVIE